MTEILDFPKQYWDAGTDSGCSTCEAKPDQVLVIAGLRLCEGCVWKLKSAIQRETNKLAANRNPIPIEQVLSSQTPIFGDHTPTCPYCDATDLKELWHEETTLGWLVGTDPNHHRRAMKCDACESFFTYECERGVHWYTVSTGTHVLKGIAGCSQRYSYDHDCGGVLDIQYTKLDGMTPTKSLITDSETGRRYRHFFKCSQCDFRVEAAETYFVPPKEKNDGP